ncbi:hypothetical protein EON63_05495 [archaeon]|nr:MAG: hypothetical protein EON63_05495 [archaeon]
MQSKKPSLSSLLGSSEKTITLSTQFDSNRMDVLRLLITACCDSLYQTAGKTGCGVGVSMICMCVYVSIGMGMGRRDTRIGMGMPCHCLAIIIPYHITILTPYHTMPYHTISHHHAF